MASSRLFLLRLALDVKTARVSLQFCDQNWQMRLKYLEIATACGCKLNLCNDFSEVPKKKSQILWNGWQVRVNGSCGTLSTCNYFSVFFCACAAVVNETLQWTISVQLYFKTVTQAVFLNANVLCALTSVSFVCWGYQLPNQCFFQKEPKGSKRSNLKHSFWK